MVDLIIDQAAIICDSQGNYKHDYWTLDLNDNDLEYNQPALKHRFMGKETLYAGFSWKITGVEFYSIVKDKFILKAEKVLI